MSGPMKLRDVQKESRRRVILDAVRELIVDRREEFSMARLAEKAGVAIATLYNLIGTKSDILLEVVREDSSLIAGLLDGLPTDSVLSWTVAISRKLSNHYHNRRHYHRRLVSILVGEESAAGFREIYVANDLIYEAPLGALARQKKILPSISVASIAHYASHVVSSVVQERITAKGTENDFSVALEKGILMLMGGVCVPLERDQIVARLIELETVQVA